MSEDIKEQLLTRIKCRPKFALQINKSTDIAGLAQLLLFVRYCFEESIQEVFMFCLPLSERCTGRDIFKRLAELKEEVCRFLQDSGFPLYQHFSDKKWLALLSYLSDIIDKLNGLNSSLQGPNATVFQLFDKVSAFMKKTMLWKSLCESDTLEIFVNMSEYLKENDYAFEEIKPHVLTHLTNLDSNFKNRFPELTLQQHERM
jgi:hypothetical protein